MDSQLSLISTPKHLMEVASGDAFADRFSSNADVFFAGGQFLAKSPTEARRGAHGAWHVIVPACLSGSHPAPPGKAYVGSSPWLPQPAPRRPRGMLVESANE